MRAAPRPVLPNRWYTIKSRPSYSSSRESAPTSTASSRTRTSSRYASSPRTLTHHPHGRRSCRAVRPPSEQPILGLERDPSRHCRPRTSQRQAPISCCQAAVHFPADLSELEVAAVLVIEFDEALDLGDDKILVPSVIETMCQRPVNGDAGCDFDFAIGQFLNESLPIPCSLPQSRMPLGQTRRQPIQAVLHVAYASGSGWLQ